VWRIARQTGSSLALALAVVAFVLRQPAAAPADPHLSRTEPPIAVQIAPSPMPESVMSNPGSAPPPSIATPRDVVGSDDRRLVSQPTVFPNRALVIVRTTGLATCTGWLMAADVVATAGHCVNTGKGFWAPLKGPYPLQVSYPVAGGMKWCNAKRLYSTQGWVEHGDERYDYGAVKLACDIGKQLGWWGFGWTNETYVGRMLSLTGYVSSDPATKCYGAAQDRVQCVGNGAGRQQADGQLFYDIDTSIGDSGSPVVSACNSCAVAIHTTPFEPDKPEPHKNLNHGTLITGRVFENLKAWAKAP